MARKIARRSNPKHNPGALGTALIVAASAVAGAVTAHVVTKRKMLGSGADGGEFVGYRYTISGSGRVGDVPSFEWGVQSPDGTALAGGNAIGITATFTAVGQALETAINL